MAQSVKIILEDDLDGGPAEETIQFSLDGRQYEIDLSEENAGRLREAMNPFISKARRSQGKQARATVTKASSAGNPETAKIRAWAKEKGYSVSDRGRIHKDVQKAYFAANQ